MDFKKIFIVFILSGLAVTLLGINSVNAKPSVIALTVLSPNGTEKWEAANTYEISWKAKGLKKVSIGLWASEELPVRGRSSSSFAINSGLLDAQQGSYKWTINPKEIGLDISKHKYYKIVIDGYTRIPKGLPGNIAVRDVSDRYFSIIESPTQPSITVLSPNGSEVWEKGRTYKIIWTSAKSIPSAGGITVDLVKKDSPTIYKWVRNIMTTSNPAITEFLWNIPLDIETSNEYKIEVSPLVTGGRAGFDASDNYFSIVQSGSFGNMGVTSPQRDEVVPASFAKFLVKGYVNGNGWTAFEGSAGTVKLVEVVNGQEGEVLDSATLRTVSDWTKFPVFFEADLSVFAKGYRAVTEKGMLIFTNENPSGRPENNLQFRLPVRFIAEPSQSSITVLSPNGGEAWRQGITYPIKWIGGNTKDQISIVLLDSTGKEIVSLLGDTMNNTGEFIWDLKVHCGCIENTRNFVSPGNYKLRVKAPFGSYFDQSDNYFSIVSPTSAL